MSKDKKSSINLKDYFNISMWTLKVNWKISKSLTIISFIAKTLRNLQGILTTYLTAKVIDALITLASQPDSDIQDLMKWIILIASIQLIGTGLQTIDNYTRRTLRRIMRPYLTRMLYEKVNYLGIQTVQLPEIANQRQKASDWLFEVAEVNNSLVMLVATLIKSIVAGVIVFQFSVPVAIGVLAVAILYYLQSRYFFRKDFEWQTIDKHMEGRRHAGHTQNYLNEPDTIDEISLYGAYKYLDNKFSKFYDYYIGGLLKIMKKDATFGFLVDSSSIFVLIYGIREIFIRVLQGAVSIGDSTFYMSSINTFYDGVSWFFVELVYFRDIIMKEKEVYEFFQLKPEIKDGNIKLERLITPPEIEFKNVSFKYPKTDRYIFKNFNLKVNSGDKIAIVGENGAGKTTLVKLLCRFYDVNDGEILINGTNIKELKLDDWYKNVGVLFQDFNFYRHLTVRENIYIGKSAKDINEEKIIESAKNADAYDFIMKYEKGFDTTMSEKFKGGIKPSKGQQQKIAIARFFYRDASLAVFDEPTASIDADAEYKIFNRIYKFFDNKTVVIISHRFSTVRNADRIIVVNEGKIVDEGSHEELIKKKGIYYDNFKKQAEGYN